MSAFRKRLLAFAILFIVSTAASGSAYVFGFFDTSEERLLDRFFVGQVASPDIVIIAIDNESISAVGGWPWPRSTYATLLSNLPSARAIGIDVSFSEPSPLGSFDDAVLESALRASPVPVVLPIQIEAGSELLLRPLERFEQHAVLGITNVALDSDGITRFVHTTDQDIPNFGIVLSGGDPNLPKQIRIEYLGPEKTITTFSAIDVIENNLPRRFTEDKIVLIGATAADLQDFVQTPFGRMPGVELHANVVDTTLTSGFFSDIPTSTGLLVIVVTNLIVALLVFYVRRFTTLFASLAVLLVALVVAAIVLFGMHVIIPILYLLLGLLLTGALTVLFQYITESKEKRFIHNTFKYYLAPDVIDEISRDPKKLKLGGQTRKVTILFSDIRGFTTISESLSPEDLMAKLNVYFTEMTDSVMERRGLVDKYIGDAVMAFWGAPLENTNQAYDAAMVAIDMIRRLDALNERWEREGELPFHIGIGLSTGDVVVGNMGSNQRFNYTIIGDEVNFSARLEGLTKPYGVACLIGESTKNELEGKDGIVIREIDLVMVKGKKEPRKIYELVTRPVDDKKKKILQHFEEGRLAYMNGDWQKAIKAFESALSLGDDGPSKVFLERTKALFANPPAEWNGVYEFKTK